MADDVFFTLSFVKREGPIVPSQVAKELNTNILFASAILSELVEKGQILVTHTKKGGSPFYYFAGQEEKLQQLSSFLSESDKEVYDKLQKEIVIRDKNISPQQKNSFRKELKDFAIPLSVKLGNDHELFWKWYLASNDIAKEKIKEIVSSKSDSGIEKPKEKIGESETEEEQKEEVQQKVRNPSKKVDSGLNILNDYFSKNEMYIISQDVVRKNKELNFVIDLPSKIGSLRYFVKFKDKKTVTDADLISAFDEARSKKLPVLFLSKGQLAKKAEKYLNDNVSGQLVFRSL